jgi:hypothetical protein
MNGIQNKFKNLNVKEFFDEKLFEFDDPVGSFDVIRLKSCCLARANKFNIVVI